MDNNRIDSVGMTVNPGKSTERNTQTQSDMLPDWLSSSAPTSATHAPISTHIPTSTFTPPTSKLVKSANQDPREKLLNVQYENLFMRALDEITAGKTLVQVLRDDLREFEQGAFLRWINKDPVRKQMYKEAKELRTEAWAGWVVEESYGENTLRDVQRSRLITDNLRWLMTADNRRTYGDTKQIDIGGTISITGALAAAQARLINDEIIDEVTDVIEYMDTNIDNRTDEDSE
jgi:hypothetical protein